MRNLPLSGGPAEDAFRQRFQSRKSGLACLCCGAPVSVKLGPAKATRGHLLPSGQRREIEDYGLDRIWVRMCCSCNTDMGNRNLLEWLDRLATDNDQRAVVVNDLVMNLKQFMCEWGIA